MAVLREIYELSNNTKFNGWCIKSRQSIADTLDLSKQTILTIIETLLLKGYIAKNEIGHVQPSNFIREIGQERKNIGFIISTEQYKMASARIDLLFKKYQVGGKETVPVVKKLYPTGGKETVPAGQESLPDRSRNCTEVVKKLDSSITLSTTLSNSASTNTISCESQNADSPHTSESKKSEIPLTPKKENPPVAGDPLKPINPEIVKGRPKSKPAVEKEAGKSNLHNPMKEIFLKWYFKKKRVEYYWTGKDGKAMNELIKKIHHVVPESNDDGMLNGWEMFLKKIEDKWILEHLNLSTINSKFNELFATAKGPTTAEELLQQYREEQRAYSSL